MRRSTLLGALILALLTAPTTAWSEEAAMESEAGIGALSALGTLIYGPVKLTYATLGLLIGGAAWGLSGGDTDVLFAVVSPAVLGDYVVMPEHVRMERGLQFYGREARYRDVQQASVASEGFTEEDY